MSIRKAKGTLTYSEIITTGEALIKNEFSQYYRLYFR